MPDFIPWWIVENTLIAAALAVVVMLVCRSRRVPPVIRHGLWLVVFVKLITPPVFSIDVPFPDEFAEFAGGLKSQAIRTLEPAGAASGLPAGRPNLAESTTVLPEAEDLGRLAELSETSLVGTLEQPVGAVQPFLEDQVAGATFQQHAVVPAFANEDRLESDSNPAFAFTYQMLLGPGFLLATIGVVLYQGIRLLRLRRLLNRSVAGPPDVTLLVGELSATMGVSPPRVRLSEEIQSPVVCALGRATLVWPASGPAALGAEGRRAIVVHELAHLARRDHWIGWMELAAGCAWWWNPLFWYVRHQLHENAELACDAWVAGICPHERRAYARALVDLAEFDSLKTAAAPAFGVGDGSRKLFERRLVMILGNRVRYQMGVLGTISTLLLALVVMPGCSLGQASEEGRAAFTDGGVQEVQPVAADEFALPLLTEPEVAQFAEPTRPAVAPAATPPETRLEAVPILSDGVTAAQPSATPAGREPPAAASSEDRLKRLEDRFDALLSELRESRGGNRTSTGTTGWGRDTTAKPQPNQVSMPAAVPRSAEAADMSTKEKYLTALSGAVRKVKPGADGRGEVETVSLTRITYKLPPGKAEALAAFFTANLDDDIEVKVKDNGLQITASAEDQGAIGHFMRLMANQRPSERKKPFAPGEKRETGDRPTTERNSAPPELLDLRKPATPGVREEFRPDTVPERK